MIEVVLWDWGGVLISFGEDHYQKAGAILGTDQEKAKALFGNADLQCGRKTFDECLQAELKLGNMAGDPARIKKELDELFLTTRRINEPVYEIMCHLKGAALSGVLSNIALLSLQKIKKMFPGLYYSFYYTFFSCELGMMKPEPQIYEHVIRETGCEPGQILFIDDKFDNVHAARKAGIHGILYKNPDDLKNEIDRRLRAAGNGRLFFVPAKTKK